MRELSPKGFKFLVCVSLTENLGQQGRAALSAQWEPEADTTVTEVFTNVRPLLPLAAAARPSAALTPPFDPSPRRPPAPARRTRSSASSPPSPSAPTKLGLGTLLLARSLARRPASGRPHSRRRRPRSASRTARIQPVLEAPSAGARSPAVHLPTDHPSRSGLQTAGACDRGTRTGAADPRRGFGGRAFCEGGCVRCGSWGGSGWRRRREKERGSMRWVLYRGLLGLESGRGERVGRVQRVGGRGWRASGGGGQVRRNGGREGRTSLRSERASGANATGLGLRGGRRRRGRRTPSARAGRRPRSRRRRPRRTFRLRRRQRTRRRRQRWRMRLSGCCWLRKRRPRQTHLPPPRTRTRRRTTRRSRRARCSRSWPTSRSHRRRTRPQR